MTLGKLELPLLRLHLQRERDVSRIVCSISTLEIRTCRGFRLTISLNDYSAHHEVFLAILKFSSTFCHSVDDSNFYWTSWSYSWNVSWENLKIFPKQTFWDPPTLAEARQAHRMHSEATNVRIGLGVQGWIWESHISFSRNDSWITHFIEQQLWYATKMFQESWGCFIRSRAAWRPMPTRIFILWTPFLRGLALHYYYCFSHSQKSYAWFFEKLKPGYLISEFLCFFE